MNKKIVVPAVAGVLLLGGIAMANLGGSEVAPTESTASQVQGASDTNSAVENTSPADETQTQTNNSSEATSSSNSQSSSTQNQSTDTSNSSSSNGSDDSSDTNPTPTPSNPPTTRGGTGDNLEVIDIVPIDDGDDDDGGPTLDPTPVRGGGTLTR